MTLEAVLHDVGEELPATGAGAEEFAFQDMLERLEDKGRGGIEGLVQLRRTYDAGLGWLGVLLAVTLVR